MNVHSYTCCNNNSNENEKVKNLSSLLKVIGEKSRLSILCILRSGTHCVCELTQHTDLSQSLISHHLYDLKVKGLIADSKEGQNVYYTLTTEGKRVTDAIFSI